MNGLLLEVLLCMAATMASASNPEPIAHAELVPACVVSTPDSTTRQSIETDSVNGLVDKLLGGTPAEAWEALEELGTDERLTLESVFVLLPRLDECREHIELDAEHSYLLAPEKRSSDPPFVTSRKQLILSMFSYRVRIIRPGPRRNAAQEALLACIEREYFRQPSDELVVTARKAVYCDTGDLRPMAGAADLMAFLQRVLDAQGDTKAGLHSELSKTVELYVVLSVPKEAQAQAIRKYARYFEPGWDGGVEGTLARIRMGMWRAILDERDYWRLADMSPVQLAEFAVEEYHEETGGRTIASTAAHFLAGTREARRRNFDMLLPLLLEYVPARRNAALFEAFCVPLPEDAAEDEKRHRDTILDILEDRAVNGPHSLIGEVIRLMRNSLLLSDSGVVPHPYGKERVIGILRNLADLETEQTARDHLERTVERINEALPEDGAATRIDNP